MVLSKLFQSDSPDLSLHFNDLFAKQGHQIDPIQQQAVAHFQTLYDNIHRFSFQHPEKMGLYLWGGVGRGKTLMMNAFFEQLQRKYSRLHYHELSENLLNALKQFDTTENPMQSVLRDFAAKSKVLGLDDLHIHDIADGKLWQGVFQNALQNKLFLIITSNYHPDQLLNIPGYQFKIRPVLEAMKQRMDIFNLDGGTDYRFVQHDSKKHEPHLFTEMELDMLFAQKESSNNNIDSNGTLTINQRAIDFIKKGTQSIWFDYNALCATNRSYRDYLKLSDNFSHFFLSGITAESIADKVWLQRFIWLIDILYDRNITLYLSCSDHIITLIDDNKPRNMPDLSRMKSRLNQMLYL